MRDSHSPPHANAYTTPFKFIPFISLRSRLKPSRRLVSKSFNHSHGFPKNFLQFQLPLRALRSRSLCTCTKIILPPNPRQDFPPCNSDSLFWELTFSLLSTANTQIHFKVVVRQAKISLFVSSLQVSVFSCIKGTHGKIKIALTF